MLVPQLYSQQQHGGEFSMLEFAYVPLQMQSYIQHIVYKVQIKWKQMMLFQNTSRPFVCLRDSSKAK